MQEFQDGSALAFPPGFCYNQNDMKRAETRVYLALSWTEHGHKTGIDRYVMSKGWTVKIFLERDPRGTGDITGFQPHGIISQLSIKDPELIEAVKAAGVPTVELCHALPDRVPRVIPDTEAGGASAAAHLLERGFRRLVFVGHTLENYHLGFFQAARAAGAEVTMVDLDDPELRRELGLSQGLRYWIPCHDEGAPKRHAWARRFFSRCDKPVGVFAMSAAWAVEIVEACRAARIRVPGQIAVVALADSVDEGTASPVPLTVVVPDYTAQGYQAAELLDRMMNGEKVPPDMVVKTPILDIVQRASTQCHARTIAFLDHAAAFVRRKLRDPGLCVKQVCLAVAVPRRTLYREFAHNFKMSIAQYIEHQRISQAKRLILDTDDPIGEVAVKCGFNSLLRLRRALVRATGMSPLAYRNKHRAAGKQRG